MEEGWTEVRYGRRPKRDRQPIWDRGYGRFDGVMDRVPSFSPWRGKRVLFESLKDKVDCLSSGAQM